MKRKIIFFVTLAFVFNYLILANDTAKAFTAELHDQSSNGYSPEIRDKMQKELESLNARKATAKERQFLLPVDKIPHIDIYIVPHIEYLNKNGKKGTTSGQVKSEVFLHHNDQQLELLECILLSNQWLTAQNTFTETVSGKGSQRDTELYRATVQHKIGHILNKDVFNSRILNLFYNKKDLFHNPRRLLLLYIFGGLRVIGWKSNQTPSFFKRLTLLDALISKERYFHQKEYHADNNIDLENLPTKISLYKQLNCPSNSTHPSCANRVKRMQKRLQRSCLLEKYPWLLDYEA